MLEHCSRATIYRFAHARGTPVPRIALSILPAHTLFNILTVSGNRYVIEISEEECGHGTSVHIGRFGPIKGTIAGYLGIRYIDALTLMVGRSFRYRSEQRSFATSPIKEMYLLLS
jgi:hypothetical protein